MSSATARRPNVDRLLTDLPNARVVKAVRGADELAAGRVNLVPGTLYRPHYPFPPGEGEVGCFLSHRACWKQVIAAGWDYALIVEDDFFVDPFAWPDIHQLIERHATPDSYIRLPAKHRERPRQVIDAAGDAELILPRRIGLQAIAQVVGSAAAARLLAHTDRVDRPIDALLQMHWVTHQTMHALCTKGVQDVSHDFGGSTIQKKAPGGGRLSREWKRAFYRAQVAMRPQTAP